MTNDKWTMTNRSQKCGQRTAICHWLLVICKIFLCALCGREKKCIAGFQPAKVVLTQKELSRLRCRRDAGATIFSHDLCLSGEIWFGSGWAQALFFRDGAFSLSETSDSFTNPDFLASCRAALRCRCIASRAASALRALIF